MFPLVRCKAHHGIRRSIRPLFPTILALSLAACGGSEAPQRPMGEASVVVQTIATQQVPMEQSLPGRTVAYMVSDVRPQVSGIIQKRLFTEGQLVKAGDVLYQIDPRSYQASYESAQANLAQAEAALSASRPKAERYRALVEIKAVSQQDADEVLATLRQNEASVAAAKASVQSARINLDYTRISAPIAGRISTSAYTPGALVTTNQADPLTTIQQLDPIYVDVTQTSAQLLALRKAMEAGQLDAVDGKTEVRLLLEDGSTYAHPGTLEFVGTSIATGTGTVTLRAVVPNPEGLLLPGAYIRAVLPVAINQNAILIPQAAVTRNSSAQPVVKLLDAEDKVVERVIETGEPTRNQWLVTSGLAVGERLIVEGGSRARAGQKAKVVPAGDPAANPPKAPRADNAGMRPNRQAR